MRKYIFITFVLNLIIFSACGSSNEEYNRNSEVGYNPSFTGNHYHVDNHIPWNECDICGLHKVYW